MQYAVQHALMQTQYACAKCMRTRATWHSPKIKVHDEPTRGFPSITFLEKTFEVAEKPSPLGNKYKGQMAEPLPACQGPWGTLHQIPRRLAVLKNYVQKQIGKSYACCCKFLQTWSHCTYLVKLMVLHGQFHS